jgi:hypothetical protein
MSEPSVWNIPIVAMSHSDQSPEEGDTRLRSTQANQQPPHHESSSESPEDDTTVGKKVRRRGRGKPKAYGQTLTQMTSRFRFSGSSNKVRKVSISSGQRRILAYVSSLRQTIQLSWKDSHGSCPSDSAVMVDLIPFCRSLVL